MSPRRATAAALVAALTLFAAGCGDDDGEGAAPLAGADGAADPSGGGDAAGDAGDDAPDVDEIDPCELVSLEEAQDAMGRPVKLARSEDPTGMCVYDTTQSGELDFGIVQIDYEPGVLADGTSIQMMAEMAGGFMGDAVGEPASVDLGDEAFLLEGGLVPMLFIGVGDDMVTVSVMGADDDAAAMVQLGELVMSRL